MTQSFSFDDFLSGMSPEEQARKGKSIGGGGQTTPRVRLRNKNEVSLLVPGEDEEVIEAKSFDCILLSVAPSIHGRRYYPGSYQEGVSSGGPACYSEDGKLPHPNAQDPQAPSCRDCTHTSAPGRSSTCKFESRVAIYIVDWEENRLFENYNGYGPDGRIFQMTVPNASNFAKEEEKLSSKETVMRLGLNPYVTMFRKNGLRLRDFVTRVGFFQKNTRTGKTLNSVKLWFDAIGKVAPSDKFPYLLEGADILESLDAYYDQDENLIDETIQQMTIVSYPGSGRSRMTQAASAPVDTSNIELASRKKPASASVVDSILAGDDVDDE